MELEERWKGAWFNLGSGRPEPRVLAELLGRYSEPHRAYHNVEHLKDCFRRFDEVHGLAQHPAEVLLALWFHDAIYDTRASDNEEESARWARDVVVSSGGPPTSASRIYDLILATRHDDSSIRGDAALVADIDLTILGAPPERFQAYDRQIRQEYAWVPEPDFRETRLRILDGFLARPAIYLTGPFRRKYEVQARQNLESAVAELRENSY
jgi:predicted metal-dependent HD superfamily phosphohydrolase